MTSSSEPQSPEEQRWLSHTYAYAPFVIIPFGPLFLVGTGWSAERRFLRVCTAESLPLFLGAQSFATPPLRPTYHPRHAAAPQALDDLEIDL